MRLVHDQHSEMRVVWWHDTKDGMIDPMYGSFAYYQANGRPIQKLRMDGAGNNQLMEQSLNSSNWREYPEIENKVKNTP